MIVPGLSYIVPYRAKDREVQVLRVYHTSRKWPTSLYHSNLNSIIHPSEQRKQNSQLAVGSRQFAEALKHDDNKWPPKSTRNSQFFTWPRHLSPFFLLLTFHFLLLTASQHFQQPRMDIVKSTVGKNCHNITGEKGTLQVCQNCISICKRTGINVSSFKVGGKLF